MADTAGKERALGEALPDTQISAQKIRPHIPAIDGLRGLAAMAVVFFHCWAMNGMAHSPQFSLFGTTVPLYRTFIPLYSGVYLFFILSGFCLAYPFLINPEKSDNWLRYATSRIRRILPPYILSFLLFFLIGQLLYHAQIHPEEKFLYEPFRANKFLKELFLIRKSRIVGSYWTLVLEWRWYLLFPALLIFARRISPALVFAVTVGIACLALTPALVGPLETATFGTVVAFLPMFALGIWAAHIVARINRLGRESLPSWEAWLVDNSFLCMVASLILCLIFGPPMCSGAYLNYVIAWGPTYFFLVLAALHQPACNKVFSSPFFVKLGVFSYSIYLMQEPVIHAGEIFIDRQGFGSLRMLSTNYLLLPALCVIAGLAFHYIGERPFMKRPAK